MYWVAYHLVYRWILQKSQRIYNILMVQIILWVLYCYLDEFKELKMWHGNENAVWHFAFLGFGSDSYITKIDNKYSEHILEEEVLDFDSNF